MRARTVALDTVGTLDLQRWRELAQRAIEPNAFLDPRFLVPDGVPQNDMRQKRFLFVEDGDRLLAVMGFEETTRRVFRIPMRVQTFASWDYSTRRYPLVDPDRPVEALKVLLRPPRNLRLPRVLDWEFFPGTGPLNDAFLRASAALRIPVQEGGSLDYAYRVLPGQQLGPEGHSHASGPSTVRPARIDFEHLSDRKRRRFERNFRELQHELGEVEISDRGNDPEAITEFLDLQAAGWKGDAARGGNAFRISDDEAWFIKLTDAFRADGDLSVFTLSTATTTIYMSVALHAGDGLFGAMDAYNEEFSRFTAGVVGRLARLEYAATELRAQFFDPNMRPSYVESTKLYPDRRRYTRYIVFSRVPFARLALRLSALLRARRPDDTSTRSEL